MNEECLTEWNPWMKIEEAMEETLEVDKVHTHSSWPYCVPQSCGCTQEEELPGKQPSSHLKYWALFFLPSLIIVTLLHLSKNANCLQLPLLDSNLSQSLSNGLDSFRISVFALTELILSSPCFSKDYTTAWSFDPWTMPQCWPSWSTLLWGLKIRTF